MDTKRTEDLLNQLKKENISYEDYLSEHSDSFIQNDLSQIWKEIIEESCLKKSDIINSADIGYTFFYDIIRGAKIPSRDKIFRLSFALSLPLEKVQSILRIYGWSMLYPKFKRDSVIIYALTHSLSFSECQELLSENSEEEIA